MVEASAATATAAVATDVFCGFTLWLRLPALRTQAQAQAQASGCPRSGIGSTFCSAHACLRARDLYVCVCVFIDLLICDIYKKKKRKDEKAELDYSARALHYNG